LTQMGSNYKNVRGKRPISELSNNFLKKLFPKGKRRNPAN